MNKQVDLIAEYIKKDTAKRKLQATFPTIATVHELHEGPNRAQRREMKRRKEQ